MLRPSVGPRHRQADTKLRLFIYTPTVMDLIFYTAPIPGGQAADNQHYPIAAERPRATIAIVSVAWWRIILIMDIMNPLSAAPDRGGNIAMT